MTKECITTQAKRMKIVERTYIEAMMPPIRRAPMVLFKFNGGIFMVAAGGKGTSDIA